VRRRILELLAAGEQTSGSVTAAIQASSAITQPAVLAHLRVLRDNGLRPYDLRARGAATRRACALRRSASGLTGSAGSGTSDSTHSRRNWPGVAERHSRQDETQTARRQGDKRRWTFAHELAGNPSGGRARARLRSAMARPTYADGQYSADIEDVWDALTTAERINRWLMPISGDLKPGGHYQLRGQRGRRGPRLRAPPRLVAGHVWVWWGSPGHGQFQRGRGAAEPVRGRHGLRA
jgi:hypothetical protein